MLTNYITVWAIIMVVEIVSGTAIGLIFGEGYLAYLVLPLVLSMVVGVLIWGVMQYLADNGKISW
jgi:hypothetical protein